MACWSRFQFVLCALVLVLAGCGSDAEEPGFSGEGGGGVGAFGSGGAGGAATGGGGYGAIPQSGGTGGAGAAGTGGASGGAGGVACAPMPKCDGALPNVGPKRSWNHTTSGFISASGFANHRGRDMILEPGHPQWIIGKFAYGVPDKDIHDEEVDIWLERECGGSWEKLGTELTTEDGEHAPVENVDDSGGRIYFQIPSGKALGIGRHRVYLSVAGDLSGTEILIEVLPPGTVYFASDVDGTLTTKETEEYDALLTSSTSDAHPHAAEALAELAVQGVRPFYLTARPEFLVGRTREFIKTRGFPTGPVHTTTALGATGSAASTFKIGELKALQDRGFVVGWAFGNTETDATAYFQTNIEPAQSRVFFQYTDSAHGGRRIESYQELLAEFATLNKPCN